MKIGASTYSLSKAIQAGALDVLAAFDWLAENGAEHIEIVPIAGISFEDNPELADTYAAKARETNLDISCYTFGASFIDRTEAEFAAELERVKGQVDIAARLGTSLVRHDVAFRPVEQTSDAQFEVDLPALVTACQEIADYAMQYGITTMIENHGLHVQGAKRVLRLYHAVARDNFRLLVDTGNFFAVEFENTPNAIAQCVPFAAMVHIKDHHIRTSPPASLADWRDRGRGYFTQATIAGEGDIGIAEAIRALQAVGYDGYLSLEYEGPEEARYANRKGLDNLRHMLQES
jgi:sugar phosphate isomerase/epimerase